jgi:uncharacterized membrane protein
MENYVAIVVDDEKKAFDVLHGLWKLNDQVEVEVRSAAVLDRGKDGRIAVVSKSTDAGERAVVGTAAGLLLGAIAAAAAATLAPLGIGVVAGAAAGLAAEGVKSGERQQAGSETQFILPVGKSAVVADVSEDSTTLIDNLAAQAGGKIYRRTRSTVLSDQWFGDDSNLYLYPYDYEPGVPPPK